VALKCALAGGSSGTGQARFRGLAYKATIHAAPLADRATVDDPGGLGAQELDGELLRPIAAMLTALSQAAPDDWHTQSHTCSNSFLPHLPGYP